LVAAECVAAGGGGFDVVQGGGGVGAGDGHGVGPWESSLCSRAPVSRQ
jgi:hypothetical protein